MNPQPRMREPYPHEAGGCLAGHAARRASHAAARHAGHPAGRHRRPPHRWSWLLAAALGLAAAVAASLLAWPGADPVRPGTHPARPGAAPARAASAPARATALPAPTAVQTGRVRPGGDPLAGARLYIDPRSQAAQAAAAEARSHPAAAALLRKIASQPTGLWMGYWFPADKVAGVVRAAMRAAAAEDAEPLLVVYGFPFHGCAQDNATGDAYERWARQVATGIGTAAAVVVVEPDALAQYIRLGCLTPAEQRYRLALVRYAVEQLVRLPAVTVYLDAGNSHWQSPGVMAQLLTAAGVAAARGFSLNVSNFNSTADEEAYGDRISALLHGKHFVIDTSRNGNATAGAQWCNPPGQALGTPPTAATGDRWADALLWIKAPGSSDGTCNGGPPAGDFWSGYAVMLAKNAHW